MRGTGGADAAIPARPVARRSGQVRLIWLAAVLGVLGVSIVLSLAIGTRSVGWGDILAALGGAEDTLDQTVVAVRVPRTILAALAGAALGVAGAVMQGVTRNPLADPGLLGVNAGAAMAVVIGIAWFGMQSLVAFIWVAILGAALAAVLVYTIGSLGRGGATPLKLALAGAATSIAMASLTVAIILPRGDIAGAVQSWRVGGVGGASYDLIGPVLPFLMVGFAVSLLSARNLNMLAMGDDAAAALGVPVPLARGMAALGAVALCGAITAVCGPIGFVGLVVPHVCRLLVGVDYRWQLPFAALTGAILLMLGDVLGRVVARPAEMDVAIVTAFLGAPVFIWIVRQRRIREL